MTNKKISHYSNMLTTAYHPTMGAIFWCRSMETVSEYVVRMMLSNAVYYITSAASDPDERDR